MLHLAAPFNVLRVKVESKVEHIFAKEADTAYIHLAQHLPVDQKGNHHLLSRVTATAMDRWLL